MPEAIVLDTSACFALLEDEGGADIVEKHLFEARAGDVAVHGSFVTLTEVEYITLQERGAEDAARAMAVLEAWPVNWHHSDSAVCSAAAKLKAAHKIPSRMLSSLHWHRAWMQHSFTKTRSSWHWSLR